MKNSVHLIFAGCLLGLSSEAIDLKQSKFTQVFNDVQVISGADKSAKSAALNDTFKVPDILRTGPNSRAELVAEDQTITRVGANTIFSFDTKNRTVDLQKGSLLFHSPKGKGGGTIQTGSATASVLGTTIVVTTTPDGGFKLLVLEGLAEVKFTSGLKQHLSAGQMTFILPGGGMSPIIVFRLDSNTKSSRLVNGFERPLPSDNKIGAEVKHQTKLIQKGKAKDTGLIVGEKATKSVVQAVDPNAIQDLFNHEEEQAPPVPGAVYNPALVNGSYRTIDGLRVTPHNENDPISDALAPAIALSRNFTLRNSTLQPRYTFMETGPFDVTSAKPELSALVLLNPFSGVFGRNLIIDTRNIDLTPFGSIPRFDFLAARHIDIRGSLSVNGFVPNLRFTGLEGITIAKNATIRGSAFAMWLQSFDSMNFNQVQIRNTLGGINLIARNDLNLTLGSVIANNGAISTSAGFNQPVLLVAGNDITVDHAAINGSAITAQAGHTIDIKNETVFTAPTVTLVAGGGILLNNVSMTGHRLQVQALNDVEIRNQNLSTLSDVNISGHTLVFENTAFAGDPILKSDVGLLAANPNDNQAIQRGYVNFIAGVTYQGTLIKAGNQSLYINPVSGSGIHISPRGF